MTTQTSATGGSAPDLSFQDSPQDAKAVIDAAQALRSEEVGKFIGTAAGFIGRTFRSVLRSISEYFTRRHEMAELMQLNDRELADIGLSRGDIYAARRDRVLAPANENLPRSVA